MIPILYSDFFHVLQEMTYLDCVTYLISINKQMSCTFPFV